MHIFGFVINVLGFRFSLVLDLVQGRGNPAGLIIGYDIRCAECLAVSDTCPHIDFQ